jgi:hypothetical protein
MRLPLRPPLFALPVFAFALALLPGAVSAHSVVKTGKERLGDNGSDEQRVDNCKVAPEHWGKKARSASCAEDRKGDVTH